MPQMTLDNLRAYLFASERCPLAPQLTRWLSTSHRFAGFVAATKSKIRKKLRAAQDSESAADLQLELETAFLLLQERKFSLEYEPQFQGQPRRPDFAVTYTTHSTFMLEVTRLRLQTGMFKPERLADTICGKLGQLLPQRSNVLLIGSPVRITQGDLHAVMTGLQRRAERGDAALLERFRDRGDFFGHYCRLSEVLIGGLPRDASGSLITWVNPQAKHPLPSKVRTALYRSQAA